MKPVRNGDLLRAMAYSMDTLIPGLYIWAGWFKWMVGGDTPDDDPYPYPGTIHSPAGIALVLPGHKIFTTYRGSYDPTPKSPTKTSKEKTPDQTA